MSRRRLIIAAIVALVLFLVVVVVACAPHKKTVKKQKTDGKVTLTYWRTLDDKAVFDPIIEDYQKDHPNVKIEYKKLETADYEKTLLEGLAAGRGPDLFAVNNYWMPKYFDKIAPAPDKVFPLSDFKKTFFPVVAADNVKDGKVYGVPYSVDTLALFSNTDILNAADVSETPVTWTDVVGGDGKPNTLPKLNIRQGGTFKQSAIALGNNTVDRAADVLSLLMLQQHTKMVNDNRDQAIFNLEQTVDEKKAHYGTQALDFYTSFADPRTARYSWNDKMGDSVTAFAAGKVAYMVGYSYDIPKLERLNPNLHYTISAVPQVTQGDPVNFASYSSEVVSKSSPHQTEAWDFISFVASRGHLNDYTSAARKVPSRVDVSPSGELRAFYEQNPTATSWFKGDVAKTDPIFQSMISQVLGGEDTQRAIDAGANQVTSVLRDLKGAPSSSQ